MQKNLQDSWDKYNYETSTIISEVSKNSDPEVLQAGALLCRAPACSKLQKNTDRVLNSKKTNFIGIRLKELPSQTEKAKKGN